MTNSGLLSMRLRLLALLAVMPLLASCFFFHCAPFTCREAVEGREMFAPVIAAIEDYRRQNISYPETLADLMPDFIEAIPVSDVEDGPVRPEYRRTDDPDSYAFSFYYYGPGINFCEYTPQDEWRCDGAY